MRAVSIISLGLFLPFPFILFGPPGTGKTSTLVEAIKQIHIQQPEAKLLVCAPSNSAADLVLQRLADRIEPEEMFRLNAVSRVKPFIPGFDQYCFKQDGQYLVHDLQKMKGFRVIVSTCSSAAMLHGIGMESGHFSHIFIDESGQAMEPEAMIPIAAFAEPETKIVLAGDHKQLGPIIASEISRSLGLQTSLLERLMGYYQETTRGVTWVKLLHNYRSHPDILHVPNELFYNSELIPSADPAIVNSLLGWDMLPNKKSPLLFWNTVGKDEQKEDSPSWFNITEVERVQEIVNSLLSFGVQAVDIGVIAPYNKQVAMLKRVLQNQTGISVGTIELFQGQERKVIILSTVRSNPDFLLFDDRFNLGFLTDPKRFNVAMTRAKALLVVIGNGNILSLDRHWRTWIADCIVRNCSLGVDAELELTIATTAINELNLDGGNI